MGSDQLHKGGVHDRTRLRHMAKDGELLCDSDRHAIHWALGRLGELEAQLEDMGNRMIHEAEARDIAGARIRELEAQLKSMCDQAQMACEEPCGKCCACRYADEVNKDGGSDGE